MEKLTTESFKEKVFDYTQKKEWSYKGYTHSRRA